MSEILSRYVEQGRQEGRIEGRQEGILLGEQNGGIKMLYKLIKNGTLTMDEAVKQSGVTREEFLKIASQVSVPV